MNNQFNIPIKWVLVLVALILLMCPPSRGEKMTGRDIMVRVRANQAPADEVSKITMTLTRDDGKSRERELELRTRREGEITWILLRFTGPANIRGTGFLSRSEPGTDDQRWLYLPAIRRSRRIPSSDNDKPFVGSEFTYEDLDVIDVDAWHYVAKDTIDGRVLVEATPTPKAVSDGTGYGRILYYVDVERPIVPRTEYYDELGRHIKVLESQDPRMVGSVWRFSSMRMSDLTNGRATTLEFSDIRVGTGLAPDLFSVRSLERGM